MARPNSWSREFELNDQQLHTKETVKIPTVTTTTGTGDKKWFTSLIDLLTHTLINGDRNGKRRDERTNALTPTCNMTACQTTNIGVGIANSFGEVTVEAALHPHHCPAFVRILEIYHFGAD